MLKGIKILQPERKKLVQYCSETQVGVCCSVTKSSSSQSSGKLAQSNSRGEDIVANYEVYKVTSQKTPPIMKQYAMDIGFVTKLYGVHCR